MAILILVLNNENKNDNKYNRDDIIKTNDHNVVNNTRTGTGINIMINNKTTA